MAEISTIARPYAEAAFRVAATGDLAGWSTLLANMAGVASNPDVVALVSNPKVTAKQLFDVFAGVLGTSMTPQAANLLNELIDNGRVLALPEIASQFQALKNAREGAADAQITSAYPLEGGQLAELVAALERKFQVKLHPQVTVDANLIGGVRVVVGDQVLDTSVRSRLDQMRTALTS